MTEHTERIICPRCKVSQGAIVEHTWPFWSYVHECINCGYVIIESEWEVSCLTETQRYMESTRRKKLERQYRESLVAPMNSDVADLAKAVMSMAYQMRQLRHQVEDLVQEVRNGHNKPVS